MEAIRRIQFPELADRKAIQLGIGGPNPEPTPPLSARRNTVETPEAGAPEKPAEAGNGTASPRIPLKGHNRVRTNTTSDDMRRATAEDVSVLRSSKSSLPPPSPLDSPRRKSDAEAASDGAISPRELPSPVVSPRGSDAGDTERPQPVIPPRPIRKEPPPRPISKPSLALQTAGDELRNSGSGSPASARSNSGASDSGSSAASLSARTDSTGSNGGSSFAPPPDKPDGEKVPETPSRKSAGSTLNRAISSLLPSRGSKGERDMAQDELTRQPSKKVVTAPTSPDKSPSVEPPKLTASSGGGFARTDAPPAASSSIPIPADGPLPPNPLFSRFPDCPPPPMPACSDLKSCSRSENADLL